MRTSRISQETSRIINATSSSPTTRRSTRSSLSRFAHNATIKNEDTPEALRDSTDIEDIIPSSRKRKREATARTPIKSEKNVQIKTEIEDRVIFSPTKARTVRKPARQVKNDETGEVEIHPPNDWAEVYAAVKEMRTTGVAQNAAVDTMGCERLGDDANNP